MLARIGRGHQRGAVPALRVVVFVIIRVVVFAALIVFLIEFVVVSFNAIVIVVNVPLVFHTHEGEGIHPGCAIVEMIHDLFGFSVTDSVDA